MRNKLLLLSIAVIAFFGCKKDDSDPEPATSKTTLIAQQSWKFDNAKAGSTDVSSIVTPCLQDNSLTFTTNGNGSMDEGAAKCNSGDPQTLPFTWSFASNETLININGNAIAGKGGQYKVVAITNTQLSLSKDTTLPIFGATTFVVNLKH